MIDTLAYRFLNIPRVLRFGDFGFNGLFNILLKEKQSEAGYRLQSLWLTLSCRDDDPEIIASLSLFPERIGKLIEMAKGMRRQGAASVAPLRKPASKLCFAKPTAPGRFGGASLKPMTDSMASGGGQFPTEMICSSIS